MAKIKYELVETIDEIVSLVKQYIQILNKKRCIGDKLIERFATFDYWYYFDDLELFIPNGFLGYKNFIKEKYAPTLNDGHKGGDAREVLNNFFIPVDSKKNNLYEQGDKLYSDLIKFAKMHYKNGVKGKIKNIFKPEDKFLDYFKKINFKELTQKNNISVSLNNNIKITPESKSSTKQKKYNSKAFSIAQRCEKLVIKVNKIRMVFNNNEDTQEIWINIREPCNSENDFSTFINNLYILIKEDTRDKNPNFSPYKKNGPFYKSRLPVEAMKINQFKENVEDIRHYGAHKKDKENKLKYLKVCNRYIGINRVLITMDEFQKFQDRILRQFEIALKELLDILLINTSPPNP